MKTIKTLFAFLLLFITLPLFAQENLYRSDIERVIDVDGYFAKEDLDEANETFGRGVGAYKFDFPMCLKKTFDEDLDSCCDSFFEENGYGYGPNKNALVLLIETSTDRIYLKGYGAGKEIFTDEEKEKLIEPMREYRAQNMTWLVCIWTYFNNAWAVVKEHKDIRDKYLSENAGETSGQKNAEQETVKPEHPKWWPEDVSAFEDFHNENASRVVDEAHIFTDEEIAAMKEGIKRIQDDWGIDLVIFTDNSTYGETHALYAADFHHFNGYGFGDDYTGTVLMICMDPGYRGWWTAATGKCQALYTEEVINDLDDNLEPYMVAGKYGEGVISYINDVYEFYKVPDWYPKDVDSFVPFRSANKSYCVDQIGVFTEGQRNEIDRQAREISEKYGTDFVVLTMDATYRNGTMADYARDFAKYNGYGVGEFYDACVLCLKVNKRGTWACLASTISKDERKCYKDKNLTNVLGHIKKLLLERRHYGAVIKALSYTDNLYEKNWVWHEIYFIWPIWICILIGIIFGGSAISKYEKTMSDLTDIKDPEHYYVSDSFKLFQKSEKLLNKYTTTTKIERTTYSGSRSSSSGHRSSYSSSYKSSGGRSYSGGGRRF
ncbi:MAG: TPM domain-containing protein [Treponema sp.]|nr:TPM domain-containing protein [Treponema sp.]